MRERKHKVVFLGNMVYIIVSVYMVYIIHMTCISLLVFLPPPPPLNPLPPGRERIEVLLAMGATRLEATRPALRRAMMVALQPMLNQMAVVGIVSIPGVLFYL